MLSASAFSAEPNRRVFLASVCGFGLFANASSAEEKITPLVKMKNQGALGIEVFTQTLKIVAEQEGLQLSASQTKAWREEIGWDIWSQIQKAEGLQYQIIIKTPVVVTIENKKWIKAEPQFKITFGGYYALDRGAARVIERQIKSIELLDKTLHTFVVQNLR